MLRFIPIPVARLLGLSLIVLLSACAQQREPGYYDTPRGDTLSDARHRAQGGDNTVAPAQLQLGFGRDTGKPATESAAPAAAAQSAGPADSTATPTATPRALPSMLADTRTYLGTIACTDGGQCPAIRMTLTLAPDGQWRSRSTPVSSQGSPTSAMGCWFLTGTDPVRIVLQAGEHPFATLEFIQQNVLRLIRLNGQTPVLESRLTRQADIDPIEELAQKAAQTCPAP